MTFPILNNIADKIIAVRGNCDTEVDQMVLKFPIMADYIYLVDEGQVFLVTHGHIYNPYDKPEAMPDGGTLLMGHTHVAKDIMFNAEDGKTFRYMNPGSPSIPKEDTKPSYIMSTCLSRHCSTGGSHHTYNRCNSPGPVLLSGYPCLRPYQLL